jgi:hypothetical protein
MVQAQFQVQDSISISFTIWLFNIAMENPESMEVSSWENRLFLWAMFHGYVKKPEGTLW